MDWRGPIAFVLGLAVGVALVAGVFLAELTPGKITTQEVSFLSTLGGASIGAVASYLGIRRADDTSGKPDRQGATMTETQPAPDPTTQPNQPAEPIPDPGEQPAPSTPDVTPPEPQPGQPPQQEPPSE